MCDVERAARVPVRIAVEHFCQFCIRIHAKPLHQPVERAVGQIDRFRVFDAHGIDDRNAALPGQQRRLCMIDAPCAARQGEGRQQLLEGRPRKAGRHDLDEADLAHSARRVP